jgi:hypothetical protein
MMNKNVPQETESYATGVVMAQKIVTPEIVKCAKCGADATCLDWDFNDQWKVYCDNNHTATRECGTRHRAICRWNNAQTKAHNAKLTG